MTDLTELRELEDPVEAEIQKLLDAIGARYSTGCGSNGGPDFSVNGGPHIECKRYYTERAVRQLSNLDQAILVQGLDAAKWLSSAILSLLDRVERAEREAEEAEKLGYLRGLEDASDLSENINIDHESFKTRYAVRHIVAQAIRKLKGE